MELQVWDKSFVVDGLKFEATFVRRAFREGLEVRCLVFDEVVRVAEFGFGEMALLECLKERIAEIVKGRCRGCS
jgi:hypothetical protein